MLHFDFLWDLDKNGIKFDPELNIDKLGWKSGDLFRITNINGCAQLVKVDPIEAFVMGFPEIKDNQ